MGDRGLDGNPTLPASAHFSSVQCLEIRLKSGKLGNLLKASFTYGCPVSILEQPYFVRVRDFGDVIPNVKFFFQNRKNKRWPHEKFVIESSSTFSQSTSSRKTQASENKEGDKPRFIGSDWHLAIGNEKKRGADNPFLNLYQLFFRI